MSKIADEADPSSNSHLTTSPVHVVVAVEAGPVTRQCTVNGFISKVGVGVGRSDNERQFMFCNGRPVDLSKFVKTVNEVRICYTVMDAYLN